jgi:serine/threonine protein kinase
MLRREARVLQHVQGVPGVPAFLGWIDRDAIAEECMPGSPMVRRKLDARTSRLVMRASRDLLRKVEQLHERRVVHLDLRQYRNILVDRSGAVSLVDFESALVLGRAPWGRLLFWLGRRLDRGACLKFKAKFGFALLTEEERRRYRRHELLSKLWVFHRFGPFFRWLFRQGSRGDPPPSADRPA